jgi:hypothetical protein
VHDDLNGACLMKKPPNQAMLLTALRAAADCQGVGQKKSATLIAISR